MIGDKLSIFTRGLFDSISDQFPDIASLASLGWFESDVVAESYEEYSALPNQSFFQEETEFYDRESRLFDLLYTEAINMHGVPMIYYVNSYNVSYDKLFGEDNNRNILRNFNVQAYYELPNETEMWNNFSIEGIDNFHIQITMRHMEAASQYNSRGIRKFQSYTPKQGDFLKAKYNEYFYEIVTVKQQVAQFLKRQHVWDLIVRPMRDEKLSVSAEIPVDDYIRNVQAINDIFDTKQEVEREKPRDLYQPESGETSPDPLFGSWG